MDQLTTVLNRLSARDDVYKLPARNLPIFMLREFLTPEECARLMRLIDMKPVPSRVFPGSKDPAFRTSFSCDLDPTDGFIQAIEDKFEAVSGIDQRFGETVQGQRYFVGQQFMKHLDAFRKNESFWPEQRTIGGQRTWTFMVFLNVPASGGKTFFPNAGVRVTPRQGNLLAWWNLDERGYGSEFSAHEGCPVEAGTKYIITKWYRECPWGMRSVIPRILPRLLPHPSHFTASHAAA